MNSGILPTFCLVIMATASVQARADCDVSIHDWKKREAVRAMAADHGWTVTRIKIDDGCYEVYGIDEQGRRFEATINPATLDIVDVQDRDDKH